MRTNPPRRRYTHDERARAVAAVAANNGSVHGTAKLLGVPETSLRQWVSGERHPELLPLSERYKMELADKLARFADLAIGIALKKINELSAYQAVICASIAIDKWLLLTGQMPARSRQGKTPEQDAETSARLASLRRAFGAKPSDPPVPTAEEYEEASRSLETVRPARNPPSSIGAVAPVQAQQPKPLTPGAVKVPPPPKRNPQGYFNGRPGSS
jgi:hypothetical protein